MVDQSPMADELRSTRSRALVGRAEELALVNTFLQGDSGSRLLFVHGPAGVGKSMLVREGATRAAKQGSRVGYVSLDRVKPEPATIVAAVRKALDLPEEAPLGAWPDETPGLLVLDALEHLGRLQGWLTRQLLPELPASLRIVLSGREPPDPRWLADPGWKPLIRVVRLQDFSAEETHAYLSTRGVAPGRREEVRRVTHGHPLTLSLIADMLLQAPEAELPFDRSPDLVQLLLEQFVRDVPDYPHRQALWLNSIVGACNQRLIASALQVPDDQAASLLDWLQGLSFTRHGTGGVVLHELVHDVLRADLRWRDAELYRIFVTRVIQSELGQLEQLVGPPRRQKIADLLFIIANASIRPERIYAAGSLGDVQGSPARDEHWPALRQMVRQHEGEASLGPLDHWRQRGAETLVYAEPGQPPQGFSMMLDLHRISAQDAEADPGVQPIYQTLTEQQRLNPAEPTLLYRYWMTAESYQDISELQSRIFLQIIERVLATPELSFMFAVHQSPERWIPLTAASRIRHFPAGDFSLGAHRYGIFGHDFRTESVSRWSEQSILLSLGYNAPPNPGAPGLPRAELQAALKQALRRFQRPDLLRESPLLDLRLVRSRSPASQTELERVEVLLRIIEEQAREFSRSERDEVLFRILEKTYFRPVAKQVVAAAELNLSFGTYRRYLGQAVERLTNSLWRLEKTASS